jgi:hypothetical protein
MLRSWLKAPNPSINHDIARKAYHDGTTAWVIEDKNFQQWNTTGGQLLWIYGDRACVGFTSLPQLTKI